MHSCAKFKERRKNSSCRTLIKSAAGPKEGILTHKSSGSSLSCLFILALSLTRCLTEKSRCRLCGCVCVCTRVISLDSVKDLFKFELCY